MLEVKNLVVKYSYKTVLNGVSLTFKEGNIYSLLGENGEGKSTLAHVLAGDIQKTSGEILIDGEDCTFKMPKEAIQKGVVCVHQRPMLCEDISIEENLKIGTNWKRKNIQERKNTKKEKNFFQESKNSQKKNKTRHHLKAETFLRVKELLDYYLPGISLKTKVKNLNLENRFFVSLAGALLKNPKVIILDEPPELSKEDLKKILEEKKERIIIIITHNLQEAIDKTDYTVLLKDGKVLKSSRTSDTSKTEIEKLLFGISEEIKQPSFIIHSVINEEIFFHSRNKNISYIPSDKNFRGSNPNLTIEQLLCSKHLNFNKKESEDFAEKLLKNADVNIKPKEKISALSGGMLQRLILEKELAENPKILVLFNPLHGLDFEATQRLFARLESFSQKGVNVIINS